jgi:hypothetical protein
MREHPILFSGEMVRAILDGRKTQTRRLVDVAVAGNIVWGPKEPRGKRGHARKFVDLTMSNGPEQAAPFCPFGVPGDRLWVRETWHTEERDDGFDGVRYAADGAFILIDQTHQAADAWVQAHRRDDRWRPSIHMPRWASRLTLEITGVRVERTQDISEADARAEGIGSELRAGRGSSPNGPVWYQGCAHPIKGFPKVFPTAVQAYESLWDSLNAKRAPWASNPFVWVVDFKRVESAGAQKEAV